MLFCPCCTCYHHADLWDLLKAAKHAATQGKGKGAEEMKELLGDHLQELIYDKNHPRTRAPPKFVADGSRSRSRTPPPRELAPAAAAGGAPAAAAAGGGGAGTPAARRVRRTPPASPAASAAPARGQAAAPEASARRDS